MATWWGGIGARGPWSMSKGWCKNYPGSFQSQRVKNGNLVNHFASKIVMTSLCPPLPTNIHWVSTNFSIAFAVKRALWNNQKKGMYHRTDDHINGLTTKYFVEGCDCPSHSMTTNFVIVGCDRPSQNAIPPFFGWWKNLFTKIVELIFSIVFPQTCTVAPPKKIPLLLQNAKSLQRRKCPVLRVYCPWINCTICQRGPIIPPTFISYQPIA